MKKEIWFLHVDNKIAAYFPNVNPKHPVYSFTEPENFIDFVNSFRTDENFKEYKLRCVKDDKVESFLRSRLNMQKMIIKNRGGRNE